MAALEVIALDTATPQLRAPGASDTYTFPRAVEMPLGTADGVLYLNGSKVVTSGSGLTWNGSSTLRVDGGSQGYILGPVGEMLIGEDSGGVYIANGFAAGAAIPISYGNTATTYQLFRAGGSEQMRLNSTGLGIGTSSPGHKLEVNGNIKIADTYSLLMGIGAEQKIFAGGSANATYLTFNQWTGSAYTERLRIDSSGNLGLGVTPSAWGTFFNVMQGGNGAASFVGFQNNTQGLRLGLNYFVDSGGAAKYVLSGVPASSYALTNIGQHEWSIAASGTAGNPISFTQAMTLTSGGDLAIGATSTSGYRLFVSGNVYLAGTSHFIDANTITFRSAAAVERVKIPSAGGLVIGPAAIATTATDGFLYVPTCAGTPTGTPTTQTGTAPIVIDTTNHKLYFYSGGTWRDAGP